MPGDAARRHDSVLASLHHRPHLNNPHRRRTLLPVPSATPRYPAAIYSAPADTAASTATTLFTLPLASFSHPAAPRTPIVPLARPPCFGPTNAILIGRKGGIQERDDLPRAPRGDTSSSLPASPPARLRLFSVFSASFCGFFSSSYVRIILRNVFPRDVLRLIFSLPLEGAHSLFSQIR